MVLFERFDIEKETEKIRKSGASEPAIFATPATQTKKIARVAEIAGSHIKKEEIAIEQPATFAILAKNNHKVAEVAEIAVPHVEKLSGELTDTLDQEMIEIERGVKVFAILRIWRARQDAAEHTVV